MGGTVESGELVEKVGSDRVGGFGSVWATAGDIGDAVTNGVAEGTKAVRKTI